MNTNKSFIGAYARNRRGTDENNTAPVSGDIPAPHITPAARPQQTPSAQPSAETSSHVEVASIETIESVESMIRRSLSVADVVAEPAPESAQVWIDQPQGQVLRVDPPIVRGPDIPSHEQPSTKAPAQMAVPVAEPASAVEELDQFNAQPSVEPEEFPTEPPTAAVSLEPETELEPQQAVAPARPEIRPLWAGAAWEVDAFDIPLSVAELFFDEEFFRSIAEHMGQSVKEGLGSVLVTSIGEGEGRSTVAIGTSIAAAASGTRVALVDVDLDSPSLADNLCLEIETDWLDAFRHGEPLENAAILSLEDGVTLLPLSGERKLPVTPTELDELIQRLMGCFDLVMFDGGTISSWSTEQIASSVDSSLIVRDARSTNKSDVEIAAEGLRDKGVRGIGVVDNFCG